MHHPLLPPQLNKTDAMAAGATPDSYQVGDLSGKYGALDKEKSVKEVHNDTSLPMFGLHSIIGRSIVVHKKRRGERWACSSIGWGWDPDEAKQVTAIASFHHPNGYAWGYIRFSQVVYNDGSSTDTIIQIRLKHPGKTNRDQTFGHDWEVYVNPVGIDATIKHQAARCTAGGYRWNPTFIQLADPQDHGFYSEQCSRRVPLRCEVGHLTGRHGKINIGANAHVFNDPNLNFYGDWFHTALGKSIVVKDKNGLPLACATIEPDKDIIKYAKIKTLSGFNLAVFMEEVQAVMGVPDWFLFTDSRETKVLHEGRCLQVGLSGGQAMLHTTLLRCSSTSEAPTPTSWSRTSRGCCGRAAWTGRASPSRASSPPPGSSCPTGSAARTARARSCRS